MSSTPKSNSKIPLKYRLLRKSIPVLENIAPNVVGKIAMHGFLKPLKFPIPEEELFLREQARKFFFISDGKQIQSYVWNEGKDKKRLLFMHGWASRASHFTAFIKEAVDKDFEVVAIDAPGHGNSEGRLTDVVQFAQAIIDLEQQIGQFKGALGHSMGGTALLYAMSRGLHIPQLTLMAVPAIEEEILEVYSSKMNLSKKGVRYMLKNIEEKFGAPFEKYTAQYLAQSLSFHQAQLVYDENDREVSPKNGEVLQKFISNATFLKVSSAGHAKMLADPELAKQAIAFHLKPIEEKVSA
ncbi:MAG: alpha/beta fold hydrolase [Luteibaculum sp.]